MAEKLTPQQQEAVSNRGGRLLVSAAAGSGKTKVLVDRLLSYVNDPVTPANLDDFLIITYTKAAASELRGKIAAKLTERIAQDPENKHLQKQMQRLFLAKISTVHSFCSDILREYAYKLDLSPDFRVADEMEARELRDQVMTALLDEVYQDIHSKQSIASFIDTQGLGRDDRQIPEIIEKVYDSARCHLDPGQWLAQCLSSSDPEEDRDISETLWGHYLMEDLKEYLSAQIRIFRECLTQMDRSEGMEKPALNIRATLHQLESLLEASSWDDVAQHSAIDYGRLTFPRKNVDQELADRIKAARNACKKGLERKLLNFSDDSAQILKDMQQTSASMHGLIDLVTEFQKRFQELKRSRRVLDFSDLEHSTLDLLMGKSRSGPTAAATEIGRRFREIMVDEYQDSNGVQDAIFSILSREKQNCFMVGDVKQSIYQFRLADPGIFLQKYHTYAAPNDAAEGQGRKVLLSHNFRSGPEIVSCVNSVFSTTMRPKVGGLVYGEAESLRAGIPQEPLPDSAVELYALDVQEDTYAEEADFVAERVQKMLTSRTLIRKNGSLQPVQPEDIVILLRSPGSAAAAFQLALENRGIRCTTGAGSDLLQAEEIHTLRSFLQIILNPRQDIPLISVLASPVFGFTADDLAMIRSRQKKGTIYDALRSCDTEKSSKFLQILQKLRQEAKMSSISTLLERCLLLTKLDSVYAAMPDGEIRQDNIQKFYQLAADYEKQSLKDLQQFLEFLEGAAARGLIVNGDSGAGAVTIMSIHKSKGLEFPVVFLSNLSRRFNMESTRGQILCDKELGLGLSVAEHRKRIRYPSAAKRAISAKIAAESISEEMRVLYVAMTRPKDRLIMTYASQSLESDLQDIALRYDFDAGDLLCREATCMGQWILIAALNRSEAGALHAIAGRPDHIHLEDHPWHISVCQAPTESTKSQPLQLGTDILPSQVPEEIRRHFAFRYPHMAATVSPSKQTATGLKGRVKDQEASEKTREPKKTVRKWRAPSFRKESISGKEFGNVIHTLMQYISYENCTDAEAIRLQAQQLKQRGFLTEEQLGSVDFNMLMDFFDSDMGKKLRSGVSYLKEFKFSILDRGTRYDPLLSGEQVLLQGVVDCAIMEPDGITVLDFKTDYVTDETLPAAVERYRTQVEIYADALQRIYELPVKKRYLYFFRKRYLAEI